MVANRFKQGHNSKYRPRSAQEIIDANHVVEDRGYETPCWIWTMVLGGRDGDRPGVSYQGRTISAYRLSYQHFKGPIPEGWTIDHLCGQPPCVNPAHLEAVTDEENRRRAGQLKLTEADVWEIRLLLIDRRLSYRAIGDQYGVSERLIRLIRDRKRWAQL